MASNAYGWAAPPTQQRQMSNPAQKFSPYQTNSQGQPVANFNTPPPGGAGGPIGAMPNPNIGTTGNVGRMGSNPLDDLLREMNTGGRGDLGKYIDENYRNAVEGKVNYHDIPYGNLLQAQQTQRDNMTQFGVTSAEQARLNTHTMGMDVRGANREDTALNFGMKTNERDFARQGVLDDRQYGLDSELGRGTLAATNYANQTQRDLGQGSLANDAYANQTNRTQVNNQNLIQQEQNRIAQYEAQTGRQDVEGRQRLDDFANQTARMGVNNQFTLGQGQLGFENRRLDVDNAYRREALNQEATLGREKMRSEEMNNRYAVFGRAKAPSARAMRSWN